MSGSRTITPYLWRIIMAGNKISFRIKPNIIFSISRPLKASNNGRDVELVRVTMDPALNNKIF